MLCLIRTTHLAKLSTVRLVVTTKDYLCYRPCPRYARTEKVLARIAIPFSARGDWERAGSSLLVDLKEYFVVLKDDVALVEAGLVNVTLPQSW